MKKVIMLLSFALLMGVVVANAQDKKPAVKKEAAKTEVKKEAPAKAAAKPAAKKVEKKEAPAKK